MGPGQFVMVWVRGLDEIPMGLSSKNSITVQKVGEATSKLFELKEGDSFGSEGLLEGVLPCLRKKKKRWLLQRG